MKQVNKYFCFIIIGLICFTISIKKSNAEEYINYNNIHMTPNEYNTLINLGFTEEQIHYMEQETYENNKDLDAKLVSQTTRYYKTVSPAYGTGYDVEVTEDEYNNSNKLEFDRGYVDTTYKTITSSISQNGSKYRFNVSTLWKQMPSNRSYDIIGIGFSNYIHIDSSIYFSYTYANSSWQYTTSTQYKNKKSLSTGGAASYKLPTGSIKSLSASLYYDVSKNSGAGTITSLAICGDYAHATSTVPAANAGDYGINSSGINLYSTIINLYDATPCAMEYASVSW